ncbi:hypothetical protein FRB91_007948, partial [Serendipita sp. 411]
AMDHQFYRLVAGLVLRAHDYNYEGDCSHFHLQPTASTANPIDNRIVRAVALIGDQGYLDLASLGLPSPNGTVSLKSCRAVSLAVLRKPENFVP